MKLNKLFLLLLPLSLLACNNSTPKEPEKPDPTLLTTPLCITCTGNVDGVVDVMNYFYGDVTTPNLQYSKDNATWYDMDFTFDQHPFILKKDETIYFRGNNPNGFNSLSFGKDGKPEKGHATFFATANGSFKIGGNIMSLLQPEGFDQLKAIPCDACFAFLFSSLMYDSRFADASELSLPAISLKPYCYANMFINNHILTSTPYLPATTLATSCYYGMFYKCVSIQKVKVAFDDRAFQKSPIEYPYTENWLFNAGLDSSVNPVFVWPGDVSMVTDFGDSTIPSFWDVEKI